MNPCHYPSVMRPRSRSPSPNFRLDEERHANNRSRSPSRNSNLGNDQNISGNGNPCQPAARYLLGDDLENTGRRSRSLHRNSPNGIENRGDVSAAAKDNRQDANGSHTVDPDEEEQLNWRKRYRTRSGPSEGDRELLLRHGGRPQSSSMDDHRARNYGSVNDELQPLVRNIESDAAGDGAPSQEESQRNFTRQRSYYTPSMVDELRKRNQLYFMDPITKLRYFHGFPWKLTFQILKVILLTVQILIFGGQRQNVVEYFESSELAFKHLLLDKWDAAHETMPYPPATGPYAFYSYDELCKQMNYAVEQYYQLPGKSLASVYHITDNQTGEVKPVEMCYKANAFTEFDNASYIITGGFLEGCIELIPSGRPKNYTFDIIEFMKENNVSLIFNRTIKFELKMELKSFHLNLVEHHYGPSCYNVTITIAYENVDRSGQMLVDLTSNPKEVNCEGYLSPQVLMEMNDHKNKVIALDAVLICLCGISTVLCSRSLSRSNKLRKITSHYFWSHRGKHLSFSSQMEYINLWYFSIILNDILTSIGSAFKIQLESRVFSFSTENYIICSIFLGLGIFLSYVSLLRYLSFFKSYNVLILTLKTSFPHVVRFLVCAVCLYTGFLFCGWVVFSPFHIKFRRLSTASECLFSLVNGDDMFVTFSALTNKSDAIWYFHRVYLYIFISVFIYVVLSVFIAVIMDNYERLKFYYEKGFPDTDIRKFINEEGEVKMSELFSHVKKGGSRCQRCFFCFFPCFACFRSNKKRSNMSKAHRQLVATI